MAVFFNFNVNRALPMTLNYNFNSIDGIGNKAQGFKVPVETSAWYNSIDMEKYNYYLTMRSAFTFNQDLNDEMEREMKGKNLAFVSPNFPQFNSVNDTAVAKLRDTNTVLYMLNTETEFEPGMEEPEPQLHIAKHNYAYNTPVLLNESVGMAFFNRGYQLEVNIFDISRNDYLILNPDGANHNVNLLINFMIFETQKF
tara:strand:+ start:382 stop:975 length:594 start_codon:yes stop_codon:yes gene_type:complete